MLPAQGPAGVKDQVYTLIGPSQGTVQESVSGWPSLATRGHESASHVGGKTRRAVCRGRTWWVVCRGQIWRPVCRGKARWVTRHALC